MKLYHYWRSSASYRVRIALNLKGLAAELVPVDILAGEHRGAAFTALNPQGFLPVLVDGDLALSQSFAILHWLEAKAPAPSIHPTDPACRARAMQIATIIAMDIHPLCNPSVLSRVEAMGGKDARVDWNRFVMARGLAAVEACIDPRGPYCVGKAPSIADLCLIPQFYNARRWGVEVGAYPKCVAVEAACLATEAFDRARPENHQPITA
ncbi:maleylacetoacetate isomerase [Aurantimonas aggregata]|uniref:Maleylacetoacetate isomerase n=1 Tax=Aurantimonas aggregata TaxID=2047720 RepID=A0A6L9MGR8_9HYPH|nr:maleylacetoacetate isomerase [Aurantimonas aggregata]NDV87015.1 maleylacetoacetate isomerase [Aurantimonas aggregata]